MPLVALIVVAAGLVWGAIYARRGSLALGAAALVVVAYVFGYNFWNQHVGPLPLTLDRLVLVGLVGAFVAAMALGPDRIEAALRAAIGCSPHCWRFSPRARSLAGTPDVRAAECFSPTWRLVMSFIVPARAVLDRPRSAALASRVDRFAGDSCRRWAFISR